MATNFRRTEVLLKPEQRKELARIAQIEGCSISELVRQMLQVVLDERKVAKDNSDIRNRRLIGEDQ